MPHDNPFEPMIKNIGNYVSGTLYAQGVIPPIGINNYEGMALASPADVHLLAAKDPVIDEIAVGMSGNLIGENTVTGTPPLQLPNSAGYPLQRFEVALSPYQEGSGDPSPDNVRPIHGTDKLTITTAGKNLARVFNDGKVPSISSGQLVNYNGSRTDFIPVNSNAIYTVSAELYQTAYAFRYTADKTYIDYTSISNLPSNFETQSNCAYVMLRFDYVTVDSHVQLEKGDVATPYEPYNATQTVLTLPQTVYTGTVGSDGGESRDAKYVFTGDENWSFTNGFFYYASALRNTVDGYYVTENGIKLFAYANSGQFRVYLYDNSFLTEESDMNSYLTNGIGFLYPLATPVQFPITAPPIPTPTGTATTWATAEDGTVESMSAVYIQNE